MIHHDIYISWYAKNGFWGGPTLFRQTSPCISIEGCQLQPTAGLQKGMVSAWQRYWSDSHADQPRTGTSADVKTVPVKMVPEPRLYPFSLIDVLLILSIRLQLAVFLLAVCLGLPWAGDWMWVIAQGSETDFGIFGRFLYWSSNLRRSQSVLTHTWSGTCATNFTTWSGKEVDPLGFCLSWMHCGPNCCRAREKSSVCSWQTLTNIFNTHVQH